MSGISTRKIFGFFFRSRAKIAEKLNKNCAGKFMQKIELPEWIIPQPYIIEYVPLFEKRRIDHKRPKMIKGSISYLEGMCKFLLVLWNYLNANNFWPQRSHAVWTQFHGWKCISSAFFVHLSHFPRLDGGLTGCMGLNLRSKFVVILLVIYRNWKTTQEYFPTFGFIRFLVVPLHIGVWAEVFFFGFIERFRNFKIVFLKALAQTTGS